MAYGKAEAVGSGVGCRSAAACSCAAAAALYTPRAARAVARPRVNATPRNAAADTGDMTKIKRSLNMYITIPKRAKHTSHFFEKKVNNSQMQQHSIKRRKIFT